MSTATAAPQTTALIVIDAQESFRHRPYWVDAEYEAYRPAQQVLVNEARARGIPVIQIFHVDGEAPFTHESGTIRTLTGLDITPDATFHKARHSALVGSGLDVWLISHGIRRVVISGVRTEQCCETTTRHASDLGFDVTYVTEATLTFPMTDAHGRIWPTAEIKAATELVLDGRFARIATVATAFDA
ncbi:MULTISPECIES: isochorismatase family protein [Nitrospirillum]|uniref:Nicotinamidase-related amidase n=1 Tax=Nitrospirillum amazonense TaxID=28077 RepID=A0A560EXH3_9PROT|nr:isochorismatase family protein [Nitrospirillum amazonense]MEC4594629.1 isochorismatase family protein [Nitrospirillum amazonense]TWB14100.1 nicotinamidase-related amidase [Nitrospirillum amazonense]